jgi:hypothetical protein
VTYWVELFLTLWMLAFMVFHVNPLNDALNPQSEMNRYHPVNRRIEKRLQEKLREDGIQDEVVTPTWPDIAPWFFATWVSALCLVLRLLIMAIA